MSFQTAVLTTQPMMSVPASGPSASTKMARPMMSESQSSERRGAISTLSARLGMSEDQLAAVELLMAPSSVEAAGQHARGDQGDEGEGGENRPGGQPGKRDLW